MAWTTPASFAPGQLVLDTDLDLMNANLSYLKGLVGAVFLENDVGVGTSTPQGNIAGVARALNVSSGGSAGTQTALVAEGTRAGADGGIGQWTAVNTAATGADKRIAFILGGRENDDNSGNLRFSTRNAGTLTEAARFDRHGQFGIGTTAPQGALHVVGQTTGFVQQGGFLILEGAAVTSLQTIAPSGTITKAATFVVSDYAVGTTTTSGGGTGIAALSGSFTYGCNSDTITVAVTAAGAVTVQRTAGTNSSHNISMLVVYV